MTIGGLLVAGAGVLGVWTGVELYRSVSGYYVGWEVDFVRAVSVVALVVASAIGFLGARFIRSRPRERS
jgi:hypothetical protein